jgi:putative tricarboxylic transport membrane protein
LPDGGAWRYGLPVLPLVIGVILGPRAELQLRRSLQLSDGDISGLWSDPLAVAVYISESTESGPLG